MDWLKKILVYFWNPGFFIVRDRDGRIIPDIRRRRHSKKIQKQIDNNEIYHAGGGKPTCLKREVQGRVSVKK